MTKPHERTRRQLLTVIGGFGVTSLAGCTDRGQTEGETRTETETPDTDSINGAAYREVGALGVPTEINIDVNKLLKDADNDEYAQYWIPMESMTDGTVTPLKEGGYAELARTSVSGKPQELLVSQTMHNEDKYGVADTGSVFSSRIGWNEEEAQFSVKGEVKMFPEVTRLDEEYESTIHIYWEDELEEIIGQDLNIAVFDIVDKEEPSQSELSERIQVVNDYETTKPAETLTYTRIRDTEPDTLLKTLGTNKVRPYAHFTPASKNEIVRGLVNQDFKEYAARLLVESSEF